MQYFDNHYLWYITSFITLSMHTSKITIESVLEKVGNGKFHQLTSKEELIFYREIINRIQAIFYINQIDDVDDFSTAKNIWMNNTASDIIGLTIEQAYELGPRLWEETQFQYDQPIANQSIDFHKMKKGDVFSGLFREITKEKNIVWYHGNCKVLTEKKGNPWQFLNIAISIQDEKHTQLQLLELQKEIFRIKNQLRISSLTKREKQIMKMISDGHTDKQIADNLCISYNTVRTHRKNILFKLGKHKTAELAIFSKDIGIV